MQSPLEAAEELFLLGQFQKVLNLCESELDALRATRDQNFSSSSASSSTSVYEPLPDFYEASIAPMSLMIQSLFELERSNEVMSHIQQFYRDLDLVPSEILIMCIRLHASLRNYEKAKTLIDMILKRHTIPTQRNETISLETYEDVFSILLMDILTANAKYEDALNLLKNDMISSEEFKAQARDMITEQQEASKAAELAAMNQKTNIAQLYPQLEDSKDGSSSTSAANSKKSVQVSSSSAASTAQLSIFKVFLKQVSMFQQFVAERFARLRMSQRKSLYGVIIVLACSAIFISFRKTRFTTQVSKLRDQVIRWFMSIIGMVFSIGGGSSSSVSASGGASSWQASRSFAGGSSGAAQQFRNQQQQLRSRF